MTTALMTTAQTNTGHTNTGPRRTARGNGTSDAAAPTDCGPRWSIRPSSTRASTLRPGTALDVGLGEGADARWLADQGWQVTAVDISRVAIDRAAQLDSPSDPDERHEIRWLHTDLTVDEVPGSFALISAHYFSHPAGPSRGRREAGGGCHSRRDAAGGGPRRERHPRTRYRSRRLRPARRLRGAARDIRGRSSPTRPGRERGPPVPRPPDSGTCST